MSNSVNESDYQVEITFNCPECKEKFQVLKKMGEKLTWCDSYWAINYRVEKGRGYVLIPGEHYRAVDICRCPRCGSIDLERLRQRKV